MGSLQSLIHEGWTLFKPCSGGRPKNQSLGKHYFAAMVITIVKLKHTVSFFHVASWWVYLQWPPLNGCQMNSHVGNLTPLEAFPASTQRSWYASSQTVASFSVTICSRCWGEQGRYDLLYCPKFWKMRLSGRHSPLSLLAGNTEVVESNTVTNDFDESKR